MKLIFITNHVLKRHGGIEEFTRKIFNDQCKTSIAIDEMRTKSHSISQALFNRDLTILEAGRMDKKYVVDKFNIIEEGENDVLLIDDAIFVTVQSTNKAYKIPLDEKMMILADIQDKVSLLEDDEQTSRLNEILETTILNNAYCYL